MTTMLKKKRPRTNLYICRDIVRVIGIFQSTDLEKYV